MAKKKKDKKQVEHPTIFSFDGSLRIYEEGSMYNLHMQVSEEEWKQITTETIQFKIFLECLKETAFPILKEIWTPEDEWWRLQLEVAVGRMKDIDPMLFVTSGVNVEATKTAYTDKMKKNAAEVVEQIKKIRSQAIPTIDPARTEVSDL
jgi:hypothetical protein